MVHIYHLNAFEAGSMVRTGIKNRFILFALLTGQNSGATSNRGSWCLLLFVSFMQVTLIYRRTLQR